MRTALAIVSLLTLCFAVSSCDSSQKQIVGKWRVEGGAADVVWEFQPNGTVVTSSGAPGRYSFGDNNRLKIQTSAATFVHQIELRGDEMTWRDMSGGVTRLSRVK
jgi:hypothetical protein